MTKISDQVEAIPFDWRILMDTTISATLEAIPIEKWSDGAAHCILYNGGIVGCGVGKIADVLGYDEWQRDKEWFEENDGKGRIPFHDYSYEIVEEKFGEPFPYPQYDDIYFRYGAEAAKKFTLDWLRERGY